MPAHVIDVTTRDFDQRVIEASHRAPVLVDFWAPWCGPCRSLGPLLERLAAEYGGRFVLAKVNSDENPDIAAEFGVRGIPNVKAFVDGRLVDEFTGALPEAALRRFIDALVPSLAEPIRGEARLARERGDLATCGELLRRAIETDPRHEATRLDLVELLLDLDQPDDAANLLEELAPQARDLRRVEALQARLALAGAAAVEVDEAALDRAIAADPGDLEARLTLANALALRRDYRAAMEQLMEIVQRDRAFRDDIGRTTLIQLFNLLGADADLVREYRGRLATTLNR